MGMYQYIQTDVLISEIDLGCFMLPGPEKHAGLYLECKDFPCPWDQMVTAGLHVSSCVLPCPKPT